MTAMINGMLLPVTDEDEICSCYWRRELRAPKYRLMYRNACPVHGEPEPLKPSKDAIEVF